VDAGSNSADALRRSFPQLDEEQRGALVELLALALAVQDLRRWRTDAERFVRTEAVLRAAADVLQALIVALRLSASS
jgi:hypothetical protein